jgi:hypothetical protein
LINVTIPNSVTSIGGGAFENCTSLHNIYFQDNAPSIDYSLSQDAPFEWDPGTVYYLPGTTGWGTTYGASPYAYGLPAVLWNPQGGSFGVQSNQFGFNIAGSSNLVIVVEAATNLFDPVWISVGTNTLNTFIGTNGTAYFSDPQWTNYPGRFYRLRSP